MVGHSGDGRFILRAEVRSEVIDELGNGTGEDLGVELRPLGRRE